MFLLTTKLYGFFGSGTLNISSRNAHENVYTLAALSIYTYILKANVRIKELYDAAEMLRFDM